MGSLASVEERGCSSGLEGLPWDCEIKGEIVGSQRVNDTLFLLDELDGDPASEEARHL